MSDAAEPIEFDSTAAAELEQAAYAMAAEAGAAILDTLSSEIVVSYKDEPSAGRTPMNPVSDADQAVEALIEERIRTQFPDHAFLGEETVDSFDSAAEFTWAVDPIDGTQNFVNGVPFYSCSIGVLQHGVPIAGAVWGAATHTLHPGVYHAHRGGPLRFDGELLDTAGRATDGLRRRIVATPMGNQLRGAKWDYRSLGSTALEGALVAAGVLTAACNPDPHVWDVAASAVLVPASGREIWTRGKSGWEPLDRFDTDTLATWRQLVLVADPSTVEELKR
jgi:myo-inositol-1(or 4)-monophosphatase